ncbi:MAG: hypothetical protein M3066_01680 [Actinomycetota bacterium]|nr:hypothetical protein [Actinomycetota bacterium]
MKRGRWLVDTAVAMVAFALSVVAMRRSAPPDPELRSPDVLAYVLVAVYSGSVVLRRRWPRVAVGLGLVAGLAYTAAACTGRECTSISAPTRRASSPG